MTVIIFKVLLVTGGDSKDGYGFLSSSEILVGDSKSWTLIPNSLPTARIKLRSVSVDNKIIVSGSFHAITYIINRRDIEAHFRWSN